MNTIQRLNLIEDRVESLKFTPQRPYLIQFDRQGKYFVDDKEFTKEELDQYLGRFDDQEGLTIYKPLKMIRVTREPTV